MRVNQIYKGVVSMWKRRINHLHRNKLTDSERNFSALVSRDKNCFIIHLTDGHLSCKCSGSILRFSALTLELSDIY